MTPFPQAEPLEQIRHRRRAVSARCFRPCSIALMEQADASGERPRYGQLPAARCGQRTTSSPGRWRLSGRVEPTRAGEGSTSSLTRQMAITQWLSPGSG